ncbi:hypothetical protein BLNAU_14689 [Blattamonas nauphoetae]|uniref:Right handed beta helix domain-containing protein n=1 Tax=Blattamonas nauphoetae TaxID=2049346 RepID=A0ABQ9XG14_9EUKA|nr:hypothetical protein BLNAU_14689 [Blattamonas nauphoetae]
MRVIHLLPILLTISISAHQIPSPDLLSLYSLISQQENNDALNSIGTKSEIVLPNDRYHVSNYEITSTTMNLNGKQSTIFPSLTKNDEDFTEHSESNGSAYEKETTRNELFRISNSTIWMSELTFECGSAGSSIATICGSCVRIGGSRVISNSERTPLAIVGGDSGKSSSITIIACSHTSSCFPSLLPLTSLETSDSWTSHNQESSPLRTDMSVTGSEISVCDACLIGGSGALFDFCGLGQTVTDGSSMTTTLSSSLLLNTTSSSGSGIVGVDVDVNEGGSDFGSYWSVSQKMIGSCVSRCTNHLYGTGIRDLNLGGSVLCSNTSFSHCTTTEEHSHDHFTIQTNLTTANTIHLFSLCTFKGCTSFSEGGAIRYNRINGAELKIESCSFDSCSSLDGVGGAVYSYHITRQHSITIASSSFVQCSSTRNHGGSLCLDYLISLSISDCVFLDSKTTGYGGAVSLGSWDAEISNTGLSNCLFEKCATTSTSFGGGGALYFSNCYSFQLDSLQFRECGAGTGNGHDMHFNMRYPSVSTTTLPNCDSTSTLKENRIWPTTIAEDDVLPDPTETATIQSLIFRSTSSTTAEIVVTLDKTVTGSLLVFVSNSEGTARTEAEKAPNIGRVLLFSIDSSTIATCTTSIGETGLLQLPLEDYKIVNTFLPNHILSLRPDTHPTLTSAECALDESHTRALLNLEGFDLDDATFVLTLQNGKPLEAEFTENEATIDLGVIGESSGWIENQMFVIMSGKKKGDDSTVVSFSSPLYFTIPEAARLTNIEVSELNAAKTEVTLSFSSRLLKANQDYEITIDPKDGSDEVVMNLTTDSSGLLADETVKLYPSNENVEGWKNSIGYGKEYEVIGISAKIGGHKFLTHFSPIMLKMPIEPGDNKSKGELGSKWWIPVIICLSCAHLVFTQTSAHQQVE